MLIEKVKDKYKNIINKEITELFKQLKKIINIFMTVM